MNLLCSILLKKCVDPEQEPGSASFHLKQSFWDGESGQKGLWWGREVLQVGKKLQSPTFELESSAECDTW